MDHDLLGYLAAVCVFATFYMTSMAHLRLTAILSNLAFIAYGASAGLMPIIVLHVALLPVNLVRLFQVLEQPSAATVNRQDCRPAHACVRLPWPARGGK